MFLKGKVIMGTCCTISAQFSDGIVRVIKCISDGYPSHMAVTLYKNYVTQEKVEELFQFGDASSIHENIEKSKFFSRDMGEDDEWMNTRIYPDLEIALIEEDDAPYFYHWDGEGWNYINNDTSFRLTEGFKING
jgi:hypothetical protein